MSAQRLSQPYPFCLHIDRLELPVHLGVTAEEQHEVQHVQLWAKLYFPYIPDANTRDSADYLCYDGLCRALLETAQAKPVALIEYLLGELYRCLRAQIPVEVGIHIRLHKPLPPELVGYNVGGAMVEYTDLPEGIA